MCVCVCVCACMCVVFGADKIVLDVNAAVYTWLAPPRKRQDPVDLTALPDATRMCAAPVAALGLGQDTTLLGQLALTAFLHVKSSTDPVVKTAVLLFV